MRFIKRFIFVLILLLIAFFVYRLINPTGAKALLYDLKSFSNSTLGTDFSLSGTIQTTTGVVLTQTEIIVDDTGTLQEVSDEELLLNDIELLEEPITDPQPIATGTTSSSTGTPTTSTPTTSTPTTTTTSTPPTTPPKSTTTPSSVKGLSSQEVRDMKNLLENFQ